MALAVSALFSQTVGSPSILICTDSTTGTDAAAVKRRVYLRKIDGSYLVPSGTLTSYSDWPNYPGTTTISLNCLDKDYCLYITTQWLNVTNVVLYTLNQLAMVSMYNDTFDATITSAVAINPSKRRDPTFRDNRIDLRWFLDAASQLTYFGSGDQYGAQSALDAATQLRLNPTLYF